MWLPTGWLCWATHAVFPKKAADLAVQDSESAGAAAKGPALADTWVHTVVIPTATEDDMAAATSKVQGRDQAATFHTAP